MANPVAPAALLQGIIESSEDAIIGEDLVGAITLWNRGAERLIGYSSAEAIGQSVDVIVPSNERAAAREKRNLALRGERVEHYETIRTAKSGRSIDVSLTVSPIHDANGHLVGISTFCATSPIGSSWNARRTTWPQWSGPPTTRSQRGSRWCRAVVESGGGAAVRIHRR